jgi:anti-sigma factor RsiW
MAEPLCEEMHLLIQADVDGELQPADAARVSAHVAGCPDCAAVQAELLALRTRLREEAPRYQAPDALRAKLQAELRRRGAPAPVQAKAWRWPVLAPAAGLALAACLALLVWLPGGDEMPDWIVAAHIRALQPNHLIDVISTDQHTVKPWFDGRLPFAPPVLDLTADGFVLAGGRLDYLPGQTAATLVYRRRQHVIDLFVWPTPSEVDLAPSSGSREGYNFVRWRAGGMSFWAVSDLNAEELSDFAAKWR